MGYLINPFSFRLGFLYFWKNMWVNTNYIDLYHYNFILFDLLKYICNILTLKFISLSLLFNSISSKINKQFLILYFQIYIGILYFLLIYLKIIAIRFKKKYYIIFKKKLKKRKRKKRKKKNWFFLKKKYIKNLKKKLLKKKKKKNWWEDKDWLIEERWLKRNKTKFSYFFDKKNKIIKSFLRLLLVYKKIFKIFIFNLFSFFKFFIFFCIKKIKNNYLKKIKFFFSFLRNYNYSAKLLVDYLCFKLKQKFSIFWLLKNLIKYIKRFKFLKGFKIQCNGRFTRRDKAIHYIALFNRVSYNTLKANIDFFSDKVILKYSTCSLKIWIMWRK